MGQIVTPSQVTGFKPFKPTNSITAIRVWTSHTHTFYYVYPYDLQRIHTMVLCIYIYMYIYIQVIHISILIIVAKKNQLTHSFEAHPSFAVPSLAANQNLGAATGATGNSKKAALSHLPSGYLT